MIKHPKNTIFMILLAVTLLFKHETQLSSEEGNISLQAIS